MFVNIGKDFLAVSRLNFSKVESIDHSEDYLKPLNWSIEESNTARNQDIIKITGEKSDLFDLLYLISREFDIDLI